MSENNSDFVFQFWVSTVYANSPSAKKTIQFSEVSWCFLVSVSRLKNIQIVESHLTITKQPESSPSP